MPGFGRMDGCVAKAHPVGSVAGKRGGSAGIPSGRNAWVPQRPVLPSVAQEGWPLGTRKDPMPNMSRPTRRTVLKGLGVALALPWLEAMAPVAHAADGPAAAAVPRRIVALQPTKGIMPQPFF